MAKRKYPKSVKNRSQKSLFTKISKLKKRASELHRKVVKAVGKKKNTRYYKKIKKGVYQYRLKNK